MKQRQLPDEVAHLLDIVDAPPRLIAHLTLVHDVACLLIEQVDMAWPGLDYDRHAVADSVREFLYFAPLADPYL